MKRKDFARALKDIPRPAALGLLLAAAFLVPQLSLAAVLGWIFVLALALLAKTRGLILREIFLCGVVTHAAAFFWLPSTLQKFGGFPEIAALLLGILFCFVSSLQFVVFTWVWQRLSFPSLNSSGLRLPLAWFAVEYFFPRLFPWSLGSTQLAFENIASLAEFSGAPLIGFLMLWISSLAVNAFDRGAARSRFVSATAAVAVLSLACFVGHVRNEHWQKIVSQGQKVRVGIVQGNLSTAAKGHTEFLEANVETYQRLSAKIQEDGVDLLVWPETIITRWTPEGITNVRDTNLDPFPDLSTNLLYGTLGYRPLSPVSHNDGKEPEKFNSAFALDADGNVLGWYHKRVLMPFGEYMPFAETFPILKDLSPQTGDFTAGDLSGRIDFPLRGVDRPVLQTAVLICYEDLVSRYTREATRAGAEILLNLTNDAWYGKTAAPFQHHRLASWRAIENRRPLIRVTNTGLTGVVDPFGHTTRALPMFRAEAATVDVVPLREKPLSVSLGDRVNGTLASFACLLCVWSYWRQKDF